MADDSTQIASQSPAPVIPSTTAGNNAPIDLPSPVNSSDTTDATPSNATASEATPSSLQFQDGRIVETVPFPLERISEKDEDSGKSGSEAEKARKKKLSVQQGDEPQIPLNDSSGDDRRSITGTQYYYSADENPTSSHNAGEGSSSTKTAKARALFDSGVAGLGESTRHIAEKIALARAIATSLPSSPSEPEMRLDLQGPAATSTHSLPLPLPTLLSNVEFVAEGERPVSEPSTPRPSTSVYPTPRPMNVLNVILRDSPLNALARMGGFNRGNMDGDADDFHASSTPGRVPTCGGFYGVQDDGTTGLLQGDQPPRRDPGTRIDGVPLAPRSTPVDRAAPRVRYVYLCTR